MTSLQSYYKLLIVHDWDYQYTEDFRVYQAGSAERKQLERLSSESLEHKKLYEAFISHYAWGEGEKPAPPEDQ